MSDHLWTEPELAYYEVDYVRGLKDRIAELEAELAAEKRRHRDTLGLWSASVVAKARPDDVVIIDGQQWRVVPIFDALTGNPTTARFHPVEDAP